MTIDERIDIANKFLEKTIQLAIDNPNNNEYYAQTIVGSLRSFIEGISIKILINEGCDGENFDTHEWWKTNTPKLKGSNKHTSLCNIHDNLQRTVSHRILSGYSSICLLQNMMDDLISVRESFQNTFNTSILRNLECYPFIKDKEYLDFLLGVYKHLETKDCINNPNTIDNVIIFDSKKIWINGKYIYQLRYRNSQCNFKSGERTAYSLFPINTNHTVNLKGVYSSCPILDTEVDYFIIKDYEINITKQELNKFCNIISPIKRLNTPSKMERRNICRYLKETKQSLYDLVLKHMDGTDTFVSKILDDNPDFKMIVERCDEIIQNKEFGHNVIKYLLENFNFSLLESQQINNFNFNTFPGLNLCYKSIKFEKQPMFYNLANHICRNSVITKVFDVNEDNEIFLCAKKFKDFCLKNNRIFITTDEMYDLGFTSDMLSRIDEYNEEVKKIDGNEGNCIMEFNNHFYINSFTNELVFIMNELKKLESSPQSRLIHKKNENGNIECDDTQKQEIVSKAFKNSQLQIITGEAGTGKTYIVSHILSKYSNIKILCLSMTNISLNKLTSQLKDFSPTGKTIYQCSKKLNANKTFLSDFDIIIIDEFSLVPNSELFKILSSGVNNLLLIGDPNQIKSKKLYNWVDYLDMFGLHNCVKLQNVYRNNVGEAFKLLEARTDNTKNNGSYLELMYKEKCCELKNILSYKNDPSQNNIVLSFVYDGIYGVNNLNKIIQRNSIDPNSDSVLFSGNSFYVNDRVIFDKKYSNIAKNTIAIITSINSTEEKTIFTFNDVYGNEILGEVSVSNSEGVLPFSLAYCITAHKSQGLEFDNVEIVIPYEGQDMLNKNLLYTAITRCKSDFKIYCDPEIDLNKFLYAEEVKKKDYYLIKQLGNQLIENNGN